MGSVHYLSVGVILSVLFLTLKAPPVVLSQQLDGAGYPDFSAAMSGDPMALIQSGDDTSSDFDALTPEEQLRYYAAPPGSQEMMMVLPDRMMAANAGMMNPMLMPSGEGGMMQMMVPDGEGGMVQMVPAAAGDAGMMQSMFVPADMGMAQEQGQRTSANVATILRENQPPAAAPPAVSPAQQVLPTAAAGTIQPPIIIPLPPLTTPAPIDPTVGPKGRITRSCHACGMRGRDAVQNQGLWPPCGEGFGSQDMCSGSRMRCYVMYGEWDYEIFGRRVISKGCAYNQNYAEPLVNRRKREVADGTENDEDQQRAASRGDDEELDRQKRHSGMFGKGLCSFLDSTIPVHRGWNVTMEMIPMCWCDDRDMCNESDLACDYDPSVCRNMTLPDPSPRRRTRFASGAVGATNFVHGWTTNTLVLMAMAAEQLLISCL